MPRPARISGYMGQRPVKLFFFPLSSAIKFVLHKKEEELLSHHTDNQSGEKGDRLRKLRKEMVDEVKLKSHDCSCLKRYLQY